MTRYALCTLALLTYATVSQAGTVSYSTLTCVTKAEKFSGVIQTAKAPDTSNLQHEADISYLTFVKNSSYAVMPRPSLERFAGVTLPNCKGPYARIFAKKTVPGVLHCLSAEVAELAGFTGSDQEIFEHFGLNPEAARCSVALTEDLLRRVPPPPR